MRRPHDPLPPNTFVYLRLIALGLSPRAHFASGIPVAISVAVLAGAMILFPSLALLFKLVLRGQLDHGHTQPAPVPPALLSALAPGLLGRLAAACMLAGLGFLTIANAGWAHAIGVLALAGFVVCGFAAAVPSLLSERP